MCFFGLEYVQRKGGAVVESDVVHYLVAQVRDRVKDAATDAVARDHAQPDFHLIQTGGVGRREVEFDLGMCRRPSFHRWVL